MKIIEIKSRGYNYAFDKYELIALVKTKDGQYIYHRRLYDNMDEMYEVKTGDILD